MALIKYRVLSDMGLGLVVVGIIWKMGVVVISQIQNSSGVLSKGLSEFWV